MNKKNRPFLKWAGGKYRLVEKINERLPEGNRLVEPFVGAGSVFLNSNFDKYLLNDVNCDLINLFNIVKKSPTKFIRDAKKYFQPEYNNEETYYRLRDEFNQSKDIYLRALIFLYMNRYGFNGLCRYNKSGGFNVPFGRYKQPYFPEKEILFFSEKAKNAKFTCQSYQKLFKKLKNGDVVYCDPPYVPLSQSAHFTAYATGGFSEDEQRLLAKLAKEAISPVLISNHNTALTQELYKDAHCDFISVARVISSKVTKRSSVTEVFALFAAPDTQKNNLVIEHSNALSDNKA